MLKSRRRKRVDDNDTPSILTGRDFQAGVQTLDAGLPSSQWELIELCVRVTEALGLSRSIGEIFGFVFSSPAPVTFEDVVKALGISSGSASMGLRHLRRMGAISVSFYARDRRDYYRVETSLKKIITGFLSERVFFKLNGMSDRLHKLQTHLSDRTDPESVALSRRVSLLQDWNANAGTAVAAALETLGPI